MQSTLSRDMKIDKNESQKAVKDSLNKKRIEQKELLKQEKAEKVHIERASRTVRKKSSESHKTERSTHSASKIPELISKSPARERKVSKSPAKERIVSKSPARERIVSKSPARERIVSKSPARERIVSKSPARERIVSKSPAREKMVSKSPIREQTVTKTKERIVSKSPARERIVTKSPAREPTPKSPAKDRKLTKSPAREKLEPKSPIRERKTRPKPQTSDKSKKYTVTTTSVLGKEASYSTMTADKKGIKCQTIKGEVLKRTSSQETKLTKSKAHSQTTQSITKIAASKTVIKLKKGEPEIIHSEITGTAVKKVEIVPKIDTEQIIFTKDLEIQDSNKVQDSIKDASDIALEKESMVSQKIKVKPSVKPSEQEKTVQFSDRVRSQSVVPMSNREPTPVNNTIERSITPSSLPSSPSRLRSTQGSTQVLTSEVFTRTIDSTGSIEVIYRQPSETLRKISSGLRPETEMSLIDTTDSSLSESVALPSSSSDHDVSSDANGKLRYVASPASPKPSKRPLELIHETKYRVSDLVLCPAEQQTEKTIKKSDHLQSDEELTTIDSEIKKELDEESEHKKKVKITDYSPKKTDASRISEERLSPILDVCTITPPRKKHKFDYMSEKKGDSTGNTTCVLPDASAVSIHSMASELENLLDEVHANIDSVTHLVLHKVDDLKCRTHTFKILVEKSNIE